MIGYGVQISAAESIVIEDDVALSPGVVIVDHLHDHRHLGLPIFKAPLSKPSPVRIGRGSFLGAHCVIGPGVQVGEHAVVAANAVVVNDENLGDGGLPWESRPADSFHKPDANELAVEETTGVERG